ncbi:MAG: PQQ-like beta-propeller repeat protein [Bacteroidetes bacterium]|nr:PQQ-like beta-propeller repeat protein [Bacteroidota bacterium]MBL7105051.1 PQQ-like beta-propeller repeat protein [Bacteroidales bacterium]
MNRFFSFVLLISFPFALFTQETAQWRGKNRDGKYQENGLLKSWPENGPTMLWHFDELGDGHASVAVTSEIIYTTGALDDKGYVFAFSHEGNLIWKSEIGKAWMESWNGVRTTPLVIGEKLYIMSAYGKLVCMNSKSGEIIWTVDLFKEYNGRNIRWGVTENLLVDGDTLFVITGGVQYNVIALDRNTGNLIWVCAGNGEKSAYNSPALIEHNNRKLVVTMTENSVLCIDASNGKLLWRHEHTNEWSVHPNTPLYHNGFIYYVSGYGSGGGLLKLSDDGNSVSKVWTNRSLDNQMGGVIYLDGRLYGAGHKSRKLICLDFETGEELFFTKTIQRGNTIYADGLLYCYDERGNVGLVKPEENSFNVISEFKVPYGANQHWAHLVIHNKRLYVRHGTSLMVYDITE